VSFVGIALRIIPRSDDSTSSSQRTGQSSRTCSDAAEEWHAGNPLSHGLGTSILTVPPCFVLFLSSFLSLFFTSYHSDLCHVLRSLLTPTTGRAFLLAPTRGGSLRKFIDVVEEAESGCSDNRANGAADAVPDAGTPAAADSTYHADSASRSQASSAGSASPRLRVESLSRRYDEAIWQQHRDFLAAAAPAVMSDSASSPAAGVASSSSASYSPDLHYPLLLTLRYA
jgi:hypothetical protein